MHSRTTVLCFIEWLKQDYNPGILKSRVGPLLSSKRTDFFYNNNINTNGRNMKHHNRNFQLYVTLDHDQTGATSGFTDCTVQTSHTSVIHHDSSGVILLCIAPPLSHQHEIKMPFVLLNS